MNTTATLNGAPLGATGTNSSPSLKHNPASEKPAKKPLASLNKPSNKVNIAPANGFYSHSTSSPIKLPLPIAARPASTLIAPAPPVLAASHPPVPITKAAQQNGQPKNPKPNSANLKPVFQQQQLDQHQQQQQQARQIILNPNNFNSLLAAVNTNNQQLAMNAFKQQQQQQQHQHQTQPNPAQNKPINPLPSISALSNGSGLPFIQIMPAGQAAGGSANLVPIQMNHNANANNSNANPKPAKPQSNGSAGAQQIFNSADGGQILLIPASAAAAQAFRSQAPDQQQLLNFINQNKQQQQALFSQFAAAQQNGQLIYAKNNGANPIAALQAQLLHAEQKNNLLEQQFKQKQLKSKTSASPNKPKPNISPKANTCNGSLTKAGSLDDLSGASNKKLAGKTPPEVSKSEQAKKRSLSNTNIHDENVNSSMDCSYQTCGDESEANSASLNSTANQGAKKRGRPRLNPDNPPSAAAVAAKQANMKQKLLANSLKNNLKQQQQQQQHQVNNSLQIPLSLFQQQPTTAPAQTQFINSANSIPIHLANGIIFPSPATSTSSSSYSCSQQQHHQTWVILMKMFSLIAVLISLFIKCFIISNELSHYLFFFFVQVRQKIEIIF